MIGFIMQTCGTGITSGLLGILACGFNAVPGFILFIEILALIIGYYRSKRMAIGFFSATMISYLVLGLSATALNLTISAAFSIITIIAFMYEHSSQRPHNDNQVKNAHS